MAHVITMHQLNKNTAAFHPVRTRFAPSPTGRMHLGNLRTALFNALLSMKVHGKFILRIEDTDAARSETVYQQLLMEDLQRLHIGWHEGPDIAGPYAPYTQAERTEIYQQYYQKLQARQYVYPCFCSAEALELTRKQQRAAGQPPRYPGTCRHLSPEEVQEKTAQGMQHTLRFRTDHHAETYLIFDDLVKGRQQYSIHDMGDFIIRKTDGSPTFMFANAIDDAMMQISHVLRGEDHLTNTPRQILLLQALQLPQPAYGHISIILGQDGAPLSKRNGSCSVHALRESGYLPLAILNYMARLGCVLSSHALLPMADLAEHFSMKGLVRSPARFDRQQLDYWQKQAVQQTDATALLEWVKPVLTQNKHPLSDTRIAKLLTLVKDNIFLPRDILFWCGQLEDSAPMDYQPEACAVLAKTNADFFRTCSQTVQDHGTDWTAFQQTITTTTGVKGKSLFQPVRAALTGTLQGPIMADLFAFLGQKRLMERFEQAYTKVLAMA